MEEPEESDWKSNHQEDYYYYYSKSKEEEGDLVKWMLSKGYMIGKKMVITGIVISSAPIVLPPLAVFSALGVAFSVPFGLLFATYACTNKLINILLPSPVGDHQQMGQEIELMDKIVTGEEEEIEHMEDVSEPVETSPSYFNVEGDDQGDQEETLVEDDFVVGESGCEGVVDTGEQVTVEEIESQEEEEIEHMEDVSERVERSPGFYNVEDDFVVGESGCQVVVETGEQVKVEEIVSQEVVTDVVVLSDGDVDDSDSRESQGLDRNDTYERRVESDEKDGSHEDVILIRTEEQHWIRANADPRDLVLLDETRSTDLESLEVVVGNEVKEKISAHENVDVLADSPTKPTPLDKNNAIDAPAAYKKLSSKEEKLDDDKMWEKIGAMRAIVGYKAPSQPTCLGELKALYVFTGVEPPASFEGDSNDLDVVDIKLKFLMAIVGVK